MTERLNRNYSLKDLTPETYAGFDIYTKKFERMGRPIYIVRIARERSKTPIYTKHYDYDYTRRTAYTKETVLEEAKNVINKELRERALPTVKAGDVFYESWGYDQTNYDFVVVTSVSPSGKTVKARRSRVRRAESDSEYQAQDRVIPTGEPYGDEFQLRVEYSGNRVFLRGSYPYLNGSMSRGSRRGYFFEHKGQTYGRTASGYGH